MKKYDFCIGGYAGCGNIGDDAILEGYLNEFSADQKRHRVIVLTGSPRRDRTRFGVRCVGRKNPFSVVYALLRSEVFLCGGGSLLQNATGNLSLFYYLGLLWLARLCGCKTRLLAAGIGPLYGKNAERAVICALKRCDVVEVRDEESKRFLMERGIPREVIQLERDPATYLTVPPVSRLVFLKKELGIARDYFCIVVRQDGARGYACLGKISAAVRLFLKERQLTPVFVIFDRRCDLSASERVCRATGGVILHPREARDALAIILGGQFLLSMRLHALVFSSMAGVAAVGISPSDEETKLASFCREHRMWHLAPSALTVAGLLDMLVKLGKERCDD